MCRLIYNHKVPIVMCLLKNMDTVSFEETLDE